jgi:hypothetical protein
MHGDEWNEGTLVQDRLSIHAGLKLPSNSYYVNYSDSMIGNILQAEKDFN